MKNVKKGDIVVADDVDEEDSRDFHLPANVREAQRVLEKAAAAASSNNNNNSKNKSKSNNQDPSYYHFDNVDPELAAIALLLTFQGRYQKDSIEKLQHQLQLISLVQQEEPLGTTNTALLVESEEKNRETTTTPPVILLVDLEWDKECGNQAFQAEDWTTAIVYYCSVLNKATSFQEHCDTSSGESRFPALDDIVVAVHANLAQVLLNVGRNDEALSHCQKALTMTCLMDKPALRKKVIHRFKTSKEAPSAKARLAAEEAAHQASHLPYIPIPDDLFVKYRFAFGDIQDNPEHKAAVEYCYQLARGDALLASSIFRTSKGHSPEQETDINDKIEIIRESCLSRGVPYRIQRAHVQRIVELLGDGPKMAKRQQQQADARARYEEQIQHLLEECEQTVWSACLQKDPAATMERLTRPKEWLLTKDTPMAVAHYLYEADRIAGVPYSESKASQNSKDYVANKPSAIVDLRAIVEATWFHLVAALRQMDLADYGPTKGESYKPRWADVEFERIRIRERMTRGKLEPPEKGSVPRSLNPNDFDPTAGATTCSSSGTDTDSTENANTKTPSTTIPSRKPTFVPSLQDIAGFKIRKEAHIVTVLLGLEMLKTITNDITDPSSLERLIRNDVLVMRQIENFKREFGNKKDGKLPVVDQKWHLCYMDSQGLSSMNMIGLFPPEDLEASRPSRLFVTNKAVPCPPPEDPSMRFMGGMDGRGESKRLPKSTIATHHLPWGKRHDSVLLEVKHVLLKAVEARKGIPKQLVVGPVGTTKLRHDYLQFDWYRHDGDDDADEDAPSEIEAFIESVLGVKEQWMEGFFGELPAIRAHEDRPQRRTPAQNRAMIKARRAERSMMDGTM